MAAKYFLSDVFEPKFIDLMVATRVGKGTSYGIKLMKKYLNDMKRTYDNFYFLKIDIKKYFYNMDHSVLMNILRKNIKDEDALNLLNKIIDLTNREYINKEINRLKCEKLKYIKDEKLVNEINNVPLYEYGKGSSIGAQTSQTFGLIYLNELAHYIKEKLNIKYLVIYMDDIVILHEDKNYLKYALNEIMSKLSELKLEINIKKTRIDSIKNGIDFLGFRFLLINNKVIMKLRNRTKKRFKSRVKELKILVDNDLISINEYNIYLCIYKGLLKFGDCKSFLNLIR